LFEGRVRNYKRSTLARVRATFILCQSPSREAAQLDGFSVDLTNDNNIQSLSLPWKKYKQIAI